MPELNDNPANADKLRLLEQLQDNGRELARLRSMLTEAQRSNQKKDETIESLRTKLGDATNHALRINFDGNTNQFVVTLYSGQQLRFTKPQNIVGNLPNWLAALKRLHPVAIGDKPGCLCSEDERRVRAYNPDCPIHSK